MCEDYIVITFEEYGLTQESIIQYLVGGSPGLGPILGRGVIECSSNRGIQRDFPELLQFRSLTTGCVFLPIATQPNQTYH